MRMLAKPIRDAFHSACIEAGLTEEDRPIADAVLQALEARTAQLDLSLEEQLAATQQLCGELLLRLQQRQRDGG